MERRGAEQGVLTFFSGRFRDGGGALTTYRKIGLINERQSAILKQKGGDGNMPNPV